MCDKKLVLDSSLKYAPTASSPTTKKSDERNIAPLYV